MSKNDFLELEGVVTEAFPGMKFNVQVKVQGTEHTILCHLSGKLKMHFIRVLIGEHLPYQL